MVHTRGGGWDLGTKPVAKDDNGFSRVTSFEQHFSKPPAYTRAVME